MFIVGVTNDRVYQYDLSTAWNITTAVYNDVSFSVRNQETSPQGLAFSPDGMRMFIIGTSGDVVDQYDLTTAWDISDVDFDATSPSLNMQETSPRDIAFSPDGMRMFIVGSASNSVWQYQLTTPWDVTSIIDDTTDADYVAPIEFDVSNEESFPTGMFFTPDGTRMFISGFIAGTITRYDLTVFPGEADDDLSITGLSTDTVKGDVTLSLEIIHPDISDLTIKLRDPRGIEVTVLDQTGTGANINQDYALSSLVGTTVAGVWRLTITDRSLGSEGTLYSWGLSMTYDGPTTITPPSRSIAYGILDQLTGTRSLAYRVLDQLSPVRSLAYSVIGQVTAVRSLAYRVLDQLTDTRSLEYAIIGRLISARSIAYRILEQITDTRSVAYRILDQFTSTRSLAYRILDQFTDTRSLAYRVLERISGTRSLGYRILERITPARSIAYSIKSRVTGMRSLEYRITGRLISTRSLGYRIDGLAAFVRSLEYGILERLTGTRSMSYGILDQFTSTRSLAYGIIGRLISTRSLAYTIGGISAFTRSLEYRITGRLELTKSIAYTIIGRLISTRSLGYRVTGQITTAKSIAYRITGRLISTRSLGYRIDGLAAFVRSLEYSIIGRLELTRSLRYHINFVPLQAYRITRTIPTLIKRNMRSAVPPGKLTRTVAYTIKRTMRLVR